jgi:hypothetical protein
VSPVKYEMGFYIAEDDILHSHCRENLKSYKFPLRNLSRLLLKANVVPSSPILMTLMMEMLRSSETPVLTISTWRNIPGDGILQY